jgi:hypothetical protein
LSASKTAVPQIVKESRAYAGLAEIVREVDNARIWGGLHYRHSMDDGEAQGAAVARHVLSGRFRTVAVAPDNTATLPRTGAPVAGHLAAIGLGLMGMGSILVYAGRRRRGRC